MDKDVEVLHCEFPKAVRGYSTVAVDDFVRQLGERLNAMEQEVLLARANTERAEKELAAVHAAQGATADRERALAMALIAGEERKVAVEHEIDRAREKASQERDEVLEAARSEAEAIVSEARADVEALQRQADEHVCRAEDQLRQVQSDYAALVATVRNTLETHLALLPPVGTNEVEYAVTSGLQRAEVASAA